MLALQYYFHLLLQYSVDVRKTLGGVCHKKAHNEHIKIAALCFHTL